MAVRMAKNVLHDKIGPSQEDDTVTDFKWKYTFQKGVTLSG